MLIKIQPKQQPAFSTQFLKVSVTYKWFKHKRELKYLNKVNCASVQIIELIQLLLVPPTGIYFLHHLVSFLTISNTYPYITHTQKGKRRSGSYAEVSTLP